MKINILIIIILFCSCGKDFRASRKISKLQSWGYLKEKSDTIWQTDTLKGFSVDTVFIGDTLRDIDTFTLTKDNIITKTVIRWRDRTAQLQVIKTDTIIKTVSVVHKTEVNNPDKHSHWKYLIAICLLVAAVLGLIFKRSGG